MIQQRQLSICAWYSDQRSLGNSPMLNASCNVQEDASLTRSNAYMLKLFARANMQVVLNVQQRQFPRDLFKVRMYVIRPSAA